MAPISGRQRGSKKASTIGYRKACRSDGRPRRVPKRPAAVEPTTARIRYGPASCRTQQRSIAPPGEHEEQPQRLGAWHSEASGIPRVCVFGVSSTSFGITYWRRLAIILRAARSSTLLPRSASSSGTFGTEAHGKKNAQRSTTGDGNRKPGSAGLRPYDTGRRPAIVPAPLDNALRPTWPGAELTGKRHCQHCPAKYRTFTRMQRHGCCLGGQQLPDRDHRVSSSRCGVGRVHRDSSAFMLRAWPSSPSPH